jgi:hypothetical protein
MHIKYRGYKVEFRDSAEMWTVDLGDAGIYNDEDIKKIKKRIDQQLKSKVNGMIAIRGGGWSGETYKAVKITSVSVDGDIWIVGVKDGRREKLSYSDRLYENTPYNKKLMSKVLNLKLEKENIDNKIREISKHLKKVDVKALQRKEDDSKKD